MSRSIRGVPRMSLWSDAHTRSADATLRPKAGLSAEVKPPSYCGVTAFPFDRRACFSMSASVHKVRLPFSFYPQREEPCRQVKLIPGPRLWLFRPAVLRRAQGSHLPCKAVTDIHSSQEGIATGLCAGMVNRAGLALPDAARLHHSFAGA